MPVWEDQGYTRKDEDGNVISLVRFVHLTRLEFELTMIPGRV